MYLVAKSTWTSNVDIIGMWFRPMIFLEVLPLIMRNTIWIHVSLISKRRYSSFCCSNLRLISNCPVLEFGNIPNSLRIWYPTWLSIYKVWYFINAFSSSMPCKWSFYKAHCDFLAVVHWIIWIKEKDQMFVSKFVSILAIWFVQIVLFKLKDSTNEVIITGPFNPGFFNPKL